MGRFVLTNGKMYIGILDSAKIVKVETVFEAHIFTTEEKCYNVIKSHLKKESGWYPIKVGDGKTLNADKSSNERVIIYSGRNVAKTDVDDYFNRIAEITNTLDGKYLQLKSRQQDIEKEIVDVYHAMEFYNLSASKGFKLYKIMQEKLRKRREVKDEIYKLELIFSSKMEKESVSYVGKQLEHMNEKEYVPRVLLELFM